MHERTLADGIRRHHRKIATMSDDELTAYLEAIELLSDADDDDPAWLDDGTWDRAELPRMPAGARRVSASATG